MSVFCERHGRESRQLELDVHAQPEETVLASIATRFTSGVVYPFSKDLRFSCVVQNQFVFLRGESLEIHSNGAFEEVKGITPRDIPRVLLEYFGYDLRHVEWRKR
ncbi:MAG: hypothetical protein ACT4PL_04175 [Phycisphaerales bacterium]